MRNGGRLAVLLGAAALMLAGVMASAASAAPAGPSASVSVRTADAARPVPAGASSGTGLLANWDCPAGNFCAWTGSDGNGSRCNWSSADPDWTSGSIVCSWAATTPVQSFFNNGTSTRFTGVALYLSTNYNNFYFCDRQLEHTRWVVPGGVFLRSHQWITSAC